MMDIGDLMGKLVRSICKSGLKDHFENSADKGLNKKQLAKIRKGEIAANQLQPICQEGKNIKAI